MSDSTWMESQKETIRVTRESSRFVSVVLYGGEPDERSPEKHNVTIRVERGLERAVVYTVRGRNRIPEWAADAIRAAFPENPIPLDRIRPSDKAKRG